MDYLREGILPDGAYYCNIMIIFTITIISTIVITMMMIIMIEDVCGIYGCVDVPQGGLWNVAASARERVE